MTTRMKADGSRLRRCPACGQRIAAASVTRCPLCDFEFADDRVTGADVTPYARAYAFGTSGWRRMAEWVWFAGSGRLNHMALMRASAASRQFALVNVLLLSAGVGLLQTTRVGWRWVTDLPAIERTASTKPAGQGWLHLAAAPRPLPPDHLPGQYVDLWWNAAQSVIVLVTAGVAGLILLLLVMSTVRAGVSRAHASRYRGEQRMTAAVHYGTAWGIPVALAALLAGLRPIAYIGMMEQWPWHPPERGFILSAATLAGIGLVMWWFWLVRLGATSPARTRLRVIMFFAAGAPLLLAGGAVGWWYGLDALYPPLFDLLDLAF